MVPPFTGIGDGLLAGFRFLGVRNGKGAFRHALILIPVARFFRSLFGRGADGIDGALGLLVAACAKRYPPVPRPDVPRSVRAGDARRQGKPSVQRIRRRLPRGGATANARAMTRAPQHIDAHAEYCRRVCLDKLVPILRRIFDEPQSDVCNSLSSVV